LIVEENDGKPPYEYFDEKILFLSELFNQTDAVVKQILTAPEAEIGW
jgi:L-ascorbate oxidase